MMLKMSVRGDGKILGDFKAMEQKIASGFKDVAKIQEIIATSILVNMDQECDPDGVPWPKLSKGYQAWKDNISPGSPIGYLYGAMKEETNLRGIPIESSDRLTITYGVDPVAIMHAMKFTEGGLLTGTNQPPRRFYALSDEAVALLTVHFDTVFSI